MSKAKPSTMPLMEFFETRFRPYHLAEASESNAARYKSAIRGLEKTLGRTPMVKDLSAAAFDEHTKVQESAGKSAKAIKDAAFRLRSIWKAACEQGLHPTRPKQRQYKRRKVKLTPGETKIEIAEDVPEASKEIRLRDYYRNQYLATFPDASPRTIQIYGCSFRKFERFLSREPLLADLSNQTVGRYVAHLKTTDTSVGTINKELNHLSAIWRHAHTTGQLTIGPLLKTLPVPEKIPKALTVDELKRLRLALRNMKGRTFGLPTGDVLRACFSIQFATAERIKAVLLLRFDDIVGNVITFRAETRKGGREPMSKEVPGWVLADIDTIRNPNRPLIFSNMHTDCRVFNLYDRLFKLAGVDRPKWKSSHLFRATHATLLWMAGANASDSLGHSDSATTRKSYLDRRFKPDQSHLKLPDIGRGVAK